MEFLKFHFVKGVYLATQWFFDVFTFPLVERIEVHSFSVGRIEVHSSLVIASVILTKNQPTSDFTKGDQADVLYEPFINCYCC